MEGYELGKDIQEIKDRLRRIEEHTGLSTDNDPFGALGERTTLVIANRTLRDIHVQLTKDVDTGNWGPNQINHNHEADAQSKKIRFGDKATYHVIIYKNNAGSPGDLIGEFDHGVRFNAAGNSDRLEFVIVDIDGETYLEAISVREAGRVALLIWVGA
jgi:hypothetical protein